MQNAPEGQSEADKNLIDVLKIKDQKIIELRVKLIKQSAELADLKDKQYGLDKAERYILEEMRSLQKVSDNKGLSATLRNAAYVTLKRLERISTFLGLEQ